ncbi:hypothetical protein V6N12_073680 [Hibiscus sabdariffa]|uniref:CCHC-type domain-containing protein n=1 Tax=Hibiscus sabdariffa TaxID=183260 RepID=A0ABR2CT64_9ROSI
MSRDHPPLAATVPGHGIAPPSAAANTPRPDADPPDPGRNQDLDLASDMDVSITDAPVQTLATPAAVSHAVLPALSTDPSRASTVSPPSYKDTLMASGSSHLTSTAAFTDNEEITLVDGDVTRSMVDDLISIVFSERVQALAVKNFALTVVVKLLGRRIGYNTLRSRLLDMWKPKEAFRLMDIENDYFLVTFKSRSDFSNAISGGPWVVEYESLPTICFECGKYGHVKDVCPVVTNATGADSESPAIPVAVSPATTDEPFGPWMKSRFNPIFEDEAAEELVIPPIPTHGNSLPDPIASGLASKSPVASRAKGKGPVDSNPVKHRSPTSVRKPLIVHRPYATSPSSPSSSGPTPSRRNSSLSNTRFTPFPRPSTRFNKGNHSAVVVAESDAPVILVEDVVFVMVSKSPAAPVVPNTLLGAVKPPNLEGSQLKSLPPLSSVVAIRNAPPLSALPQDQ